MAYFRVSRLAKPMNLKRALRTAETYAILASNRVEAREPNRYPIGSAPEVGLAMKIVQIRKWNRVDSVAKEVRRTTGAVQTSVFRFNDRTNDGLTLMIE